MPAGRLLFPSFPQKQLLPWLLAAAGSALLAFGLVDGDNVTAVLGGAALAAALIAFPLARAVLGAPPAEGENEPTEELPPDSEGP